MGFTLINTSSCTKDDDNKNNPATTDNYASVSNFIAANSSPMQTCTLDCSVGGTFTTPNGTIVSIPASAFITQNGSLATGTVTIKFKDVYRKSDMLFNGVSTNLYGGGPMKSAGMFYIKAMQGTQALNLRWGNKITIKQPFNGLAMDNQMKPFILQKVDSLNGWVAPQPDSIGYPSDSLYWNASSYIFSLYQFNSPIDSGTWSNSDNPSFFSAYSQTILALHPNFSCSDYSPELFLLFSGVNSMVHVYWDGINFSYNFAPLGLKCTAVAIGTKGGKLYSSFTPITISNNMTVNFTLTETTTADFKTQLNALN